MLLSINTGETPVTPVVGIRAYGALTSASLPLTL
nr:MAG TPA: hypothetical protein [Inoviridae sp.]